MMKVAYTLVFFVMLGANARLLWDLLIIQVRILIAVALFDTLLYRLIEVHLATLIALDDWVGDLIFLTQKVLNEVDEHTRRVLELMLFVVVGRIHHGKNWMVEVVSVLDPAVSGLSGPVVAHFGHQRCPVQHGLVPVLVPAVAG